MSMDELFVHSTVNTSTLVQYNSTAYYMALDDNNHVIVADRFNERVVVLKSDLQLKRVLIPSLDRQPSETVFE
jgi:hypothetical protein